MSDRSDPGCHEELRVELAATRAQVNALQGELKAIRQSPAWRLVTLYRSWLRNGRARVLPRLVDHLVRAFIGLMPSDSPVIDQKWLDVLGPTAQASMSRPTGRLVSCPDPAFGGKVFYVENGRRHWVLSAEHLEGYGLSLSETSSVSIDEIRTYQVAGPLPRLWSERARKNPPRTDPSALREIATSHLRGSGIEFGAGTYPMPAPLHCEVKFADFVSEQDLRDRAYAAQGNDFVRLSYIMSLEEITGLENESLDFVIACHVIEHLRNPLRALESVWEKLRVGGSCVLVVPDKRLIFDRNREITSLEHLILDYEDPSPHRDHEHYVEFFAKVYNVPADALGERVRHALATNEDLHFHTWTYESFRTMVEYFQRIRPWKAVWSHPAVEGIEESIEFYFVLQK